MRHKGVWLAVFAMMMVMTTTVSARPVEAYSGMVSLPSGEELMDPHQGRYYGIPPDGGPHTMEIGAWPSRLFNSVAAAGVDGDQLLGPIPQDIGPISRVEFKVRNPRTYEVLLDFDGSVDEFLSLGTLLPDDYATPSEFKFHMDMSFPVGVECWYAELVIWTGDNRAGHAEMRIYAGGYRRFVDTYGRWY